VPVNKTLILALMGLVLILTLAGVYVAHESYKTTITYEVLGGNEVNGTYVLYVKEIVNYGPFGGQQPPLTPPFGSTPEPLKAIPSTQLTGRTGAESRCFT